MTLYLDHFNEVAPKVIWDSAVGSNKYYRIVQITRANEEYTNVNFAFEYSTTQNAMDFRTWLPAECPDKSTMLEMFLKEVFQNKFEGMEPVSIKSDDESEEPEEPE